jgi:hypothetical protein
MWGMNLFLLDEETARDMLVACGLLPDRTPGLQA